MASIRNFSLDSPFACRHAIPAWAVASVKMSAVAETCQRPTAIRIPNAISMPSADNAATRQRVTWAQSCAASVLPQQVQHRLEFAECVHIAGLRAHFYAATVDLTGFIALAEFLECLTAVIVRGNVLRVDLHQFAI